MGNSEISRKSHEVVDFHAKYPACLPKSNFDICAGKSWKMSSNFVSNSFVSLEKRKTYVSFFMKNCMSSNDTVNKISDIESHAITKLRIN